MKKLGLLAGVAALALSSSALAISYDFTDVQTPGASLGGVLSDKSYTGWFNLVAPGTDKGILQTVNITGYDSGNGTFSDKGSFQAPGLLADVTASFYVKSQGLGTLVEINLGNSEDWNPILPGSWKKTFTINDLSGTLNVLETSGQLKYTVEAYSLADCVTLEYAMLQANSGVNGSSVPDGGTTVSLLGLALVGCFGVQRKWAAAK